MLLRQYGVACTLYFPLIEFGGTSFESTPVTIASGDCQICKDGGAFANTTTASFSHVAGGIYSIPLTATEMQAKNIVVKIVDQSGTKEWEDQVMIIDTVNHASAEIPKIWSTLQDTAAGAITAASLAADTITAAKVAADVTTELQTGLPTAAQIADAVWDEAVSGHQSANSFGNAFDDATVPELAAVASAARNDIADSILKRDVDNVEASAPVHSLTGAILKLVSKFTAATGVTTRTNGTTTFMTQAITTDDSADPISVIGAAS